MSDQINRVKKMFRDDELLSIITKGAGAGLILKVMSAGLSFLMFLFLAWAMPAAEYGRFSFAFSTAMFLSVVAGMGLQTAILKWYPALKVAKENAKADSIVHWGAGVTLCFALLVAIAGAGFLLAVDGHVSLYVAMALLIPIAFSEYLASALRALGMVVSSLLPKDILWRVAILLLALFVIARGQQISAQTTLIFMAAVLAILVTLQYLFLATKVSTSRADRQYIDKRAHLIEVGPMWGAALLFACTQHVDIVLLGLFLTPETVGPYFAAVKIASLLGLMLIASNMIAAPLIARYYAAKDMANLQRTLRLIALGISVPTLIAYIVLIFLGKVLLGWFGEGYETGYVPLLLIGAGFAFNAICGPTGYLMQMTGNGRRYLWVMFVTYAIVVPMQIALIQLYGANGAAIGTLFGLVMWNLWVRKIAIRDVGVDPTVFQFLKVGN